MMDTMIEEGDADLTALKSGKREIDAKTYDIEESSVNGAISILCFDGDNLAYMIGEYEGEETVLSSNCFAINEFCLLESAGTG